jgi:hypothetical protein
MEMKISVPDRIALLPKPTTYKKMNGLSFSDLSCQLVALIIQVHLVAWLKEE